MVFPQFVRATLPPLALACVVGMGCYNPADVALSSSSTPAVGPTIPRPAEVIAVLVAAEPQPLYETLRSGRSLALPGRTWYASILARAGLALSSAELVDPAGGLRAALVAPASDATDRAAAVVVAVPMRAPDRLLALATSGHDARFRVVRDAAGIDWLEPKRADEGSSYRAVVRNRFLFARTRDAIARAGPYLSQRDPNAVLSDGATAGSGVLVELDGVRVAASAPSLGALLFAGDGRSACPSWRGTVASVAGSTAPPLVSQRCVADARTSSIALDSKNIDALAALLIGPAPVDGGG